MDVENAFEAAKKLPEPRPGMTLQKVPLEVALAYMSMHRLEKDMFWGDRLIVKFESGLVTESQIASHG